MLPVQYASTINIGVLDWQLLILLLMLQHSGMANTNINNLWPMVDKLRVLVEGIWPNRRGREAGKWVNSCFNVHCRTEHPIFVYPIRRITTFRSTTDRIYNGSPII